MNFLATVIGRARELRIARCEKHLSNAFAIRNSQLYVLPLASFLTSPYYRLMIRAAYSYFSSGFWFTTGSRGARTFTTE
jgi:hypothetical protein